MGSHLSVLYNEESVSFVLNRRFSTPEASHMFIIVYKYITQSAKDRVRYRNCHVSVVIVALHTTFI